MTEVADDLDQENRKMCNESTRTIYHPPYRGIRCRDSYEAIWHELFDYTDERYIEQAIRELHEIPANKYKSDIKNMAKAIKLSLIQAKQYYDAAGIVDLYTKPNLLYYGAVSLAMALVMYKLGGDYAPEKMRKGHRHHGLIFDYGRVGRHLFDSPDKPVAEILKEIQCTTHRCGLFVIFSKALHGEGVHVIQKSYRLGREGMDLMTSHTTLPRLACSPVPPHTRMNLRSLLPQLPDLYNTMLKRGVDPVTVPVTAIQLIKAAGNGGFSLNMDLWQNKTLVEQIDWGEMNDWSIEELQYDDSTFFSVRKSVNHIKELHSVSLMQSSAGRIFLRRGIDGLLWIPEAANLLICLYCLSMLVRYYPDVWGRMLEERSDLRLVISDLIDASYFKFPHLMLNEMTDSCYRFYSEYPG